MSVENTPRRGQRNRTMSLKAQENSMISPALAKLHLGSSHIMQLSDSDAENDVQIEKPTVLHNEEEVGGDKIFNFQTRKSKQGMLMKAQEVNSVTKTPHAERNRLREEVTAKILEENDSSDAADFSDSGSEYEASESQSSEEEEEDEEEEEVPLQRTRSRTANKALPKNVPNRGTRNYTINTEDYFANNHSKKILTSNNTLDKLETPRLPQDQLRKLLSKVAVQDEHETPFENLRSANTASFAKWIYLLREKFNVLLYGLGAKKQLLDAFHEEQLKHLPVIVVNGFFPSITIKDVLDGIVVDLLELKTNPTNVYEACDLIENEFSYIPNTHLYLIVHNIELIKGSKSQNVLAKLAAVDNIHLIASIDHINAPLVWDHSKLSKFNFSWWDVTTFEHYSEETSYENSMLVQGSGTLALSSLRNVFLSLTSNSKGIYLILVKYQLEHGKNQYYQGLPFKDLYSLCREAFLVSSDMALRAQLTEFIDHKMVKNRRSNDGVEYLIIPLSINVLQQFLNEHGSTT